MKKTRIILPLAVVCMMCCAMAGCGHSKADRERADSLVAAADALELQGFGAVGSDSEVEKYYIEALANCREAESLGLDTKTMQEHLLGNLRAIRGVVESQLTLAEGMPMAQDALKRRIARLDSVIGR